MSIYTCVYCGGTGSVPTHRTDCPGYVGRHEAPLFPAEPEPAEKIRPRFWIKQADGVILVYHPSVGMGNLIGSYTEGHGGVDSYGNAYPAGRSTLTDFDYSDVPGFPPPSIFGQPAAGRAAAIASARELLAQYQEYRHELTLGASKHGWDGWVGRAAAVLEELIRDA